MKLPELAVKRKTTFLMVFILMLGLGVFGLAQLGLDLFPSLSLPKILVLTTMPGAGPEEIESLVTEVVEESSSIVNRVNHIQSSSVANLSVVTVEFSWGTDMNQAEIDLRNSLDYNSSQFPEDADDPLVMPLDPSMAPAMLVTISSDVLNDVDLRRIAEEEIEPQLTRIEGVASCEVHGGLTRQINVEANPALMARHNIGISQIAAAISPVRNNIPAGEMDTGGRNFILKVESAFHDVTEIENLVVGYHDGVPVHVTDVCTVSDDTDESNVVINVDGENTVLMMVMRRNDANTVEVCNRLQESLDEITDSYGNRLSAGVIFNQSTFIKGSVSNLRSTGIQAVVIAFLVLLVFLRSGKSAGTVGLAIPLSIMLTFPVMALLDINLNLVSLAGLALAVGMLVDNSIVVLENIFRHREEMREDPVTAAIEGASEVGMAIGASTLTTLAVFIPIMLVPGIAGQIFHDLSVTVSSTLIVSLFVALTLIPLVTSRMKTIRLTDTEEGKAVKNSFTHRVSEGIKKSLDNLDKSYAKALAGTIKRKKTVIASATMLFILSIIVAGMLPTEFIPALDNGLAQFIVYRSTGTSLESTDSTMVLIAAELAEILPPEDVEHIYYRAGSDGGLSDISGASGCNEAELLVKLVPAVERSLSKEEYEQILRDVLSRYPDVEFEKNDQISAALQGGADVTVNVYGDDIEELRLIGEDLSQQLKNIDGIEEARSSLSDRISQLAFVPDYNMLSLRAASPALLGYEANLAFMGSNITVLRDGDQEYDVNLRYPEAFRSSREDIGGAILNGLPVDAWGDVEETLIPKAITRRDQNRVVTITCSISGKTVGQIAPEVESLMSNYDLGNNRYEISGQVADQKETFKWLIIALVAAAILVYMVMASQFESLLEPFIIILTVPMAFTGAILMLLVTGTSLSALSFVGIIMLAGIVVNNGIVLVDYANQLHAKGIKLSEAIVTAGRTRLRPILMTAATTILAMIPLAIGRGDGGQLYAPMARAVIGGLTVATFLTLFVVPCLYLVFGKFKTD